MELLTVLLLAVSLSFDSFAVSISCGLTVRTIHFRQALGVASIFAAVQGICFFTGWLLGQSVRDLVSGYDHWVAFGLLTLIGGKMIYESITNRNKEENKNRNPLKFQSALAMGIATSIDAVIIGLSIALLSITFQHVCCMVAIIALVTGIAAMIGMLIGKKAGKHIGDNAEIIGGLVLIGIGVKILFEHIYI